MKDYFCPYQQSNTNSGRGLVLGENLGPPTKGIPMLLEPGCCSYLKPLATSKLVVAAPPASYRAISCATEATRNGKPLSPPPRACNDTQCWVVLGGNGHKHFQGDLHWNRHRITTSPGHQSSYPHRLVWEEHSIKLTATHDTHNWHDGWCIFCLIPVCQLPLENFLLS